jgi:hypothetical protein
MVGRALGHLVASGTATIAMGCAPLKPQRRGAKRPRYGGNFGGCLAIGIVAGNREEWARILAHQSRARARVLISDKAEFAEAMEGPKRWRADHPRRPIQ